MSQMPSVDPMRMPGRSRERSSLMVVGISLLLVAVGFVAGAFTSRAFGQPAVAAVIRSRTTLPRPGFNPGGPLVPGGRLPGTTVPGGGVPGRLPSANGSIAVGTIQSVKGSTVTIRTLRGQTLTVQVGSSTVIRVVKTGSVGDLTTGSTILVAGTRTSPDTLQARMISAGNALAGELRGIGGSPSFGGSSSSGGGANQ
ncbi:MAG TPA: hypothetical protein VEM41_00945 [Actinomycetota bacterium]|nr:hypothetical protein [Actinomycetota bacterium]